MPSQADYDNGNIWKSFKLICCVLAGVIVAANYFPLKEGLAKTKPADPSPYMRDELTRGIDTWHDRWAEMRREPIEDRRCEFDGDGESRPVGTGDRLAERSRAVTPAPPAAEHRRRGEGRKEAGVTSSPSKHSRRGWDSRGWDYGYDCPRGMEDCW